MADKSQRVSLNRIARHQMQCFVNQNGGEDMHTYRLQWQCLKTGTRTHEDVKITGMELTHYVKMLKNPMLNTTRLGHRLTDIKLFTHTTVKV